MAVRAGVQLGVSVTSSMSSNSIEARGYERLHRGFRTVCYSSSRTANFRNRWGARSNSGLSHGPSDGGSARYPPWRARCSPQKIAQGHAACGACLFSLVNLPRIPVKFLTQNPKVLRGGRRSLLTQNPQVLRRGREEGGSRVLTQTPQVLRRGREEGGSRVLTQNPQVLRGGKEGAGAGF